MKKKPKLLWQGNIGGDPNNPFIKHPFVILSEKGNLTKKQWRIIKNSFLNSAGKSRGQISEAGGYYEADSLPSLESYENM